MLIDEKYLQLVDLGKCNDIEFMYDSNDKLMQVTYRGNVIINRHMKSDTLKYNRFVHYVAHRQHVTYISYECCCRTTRQQEDELRKLFLPKWYLIKVIGYDYIFVLKNQIQYFKKALINHYNFLLDACRDLLDMFKKSNFKWNIYINECENIKDWYKLNYADDDMADVINDDVTFHSLYLCLKKGYDIYDILGNNIDTVIRERIFAVLANIYADGDYDVIYDLWMKKGVKA